MIDYEIEIFNEVASALEAAHSGILVTRENLLIPETLPCVCVRESGNVTDKSSIDSSGAQVRANLTYVVTVFVNRRVGAKEQAKSLLNTADGAMFAMKFNRTYSEHVDREGSGIYKIIARYQGQVDANGKMYRR